MKNRPRPTVVENIREKMNAPVVNLNDVNNVIVCAKRGGFSAMMGVEIEAVGASMRRLEEAIKQGAAQSAAAPAPAPTGPPAEPAKG